MPQGAKLTSSADARGTSPATSRLRAPGSSSRPSGSRYGLRSPSPLPQTTMSSPSFRRGQPERNGSTRALATTSSAVRCAPAGAAPTSDAATAAANGSQPGVRWLRCSLDVDNLQPSHDGLEWPAQFTTSHHRIKAPSETGQSLDCVGLGRSDQDRPQPIPDLATSSVWRGWAATRSLWRSLNRTPREPRRRRAGPPRHRRIRRNIGRRPGRRAPARRNNPCVA
jgi:hypothetical protein